MKTTRPIRSRRSMQGLSLVELMIAMTLGLIVLAALASVFANTSASRAELERTSRQIENGRFAMELLSEDVRHAGFYGEANVKGRTIAGSLSSDPNGPANTLCHVDGSIAAESEYWKKAMVIHVQGFDNGEFPPPCFAKPLKANTDIIAIRRASTCEAGVGDCPGPDATKNYMQASKCKEETATPEFIGFGVYGSTTFGRKAKDCTSAAKLRKYIQRMYYVSPDNVLMRLELDDVRLIEIPMVEGIEELNFVYGLDEDGDGTPEVYTADPNTYNGCLPNPGAVCVENNWANVVTVSIHLLARNTEESPGYTDAKVYSLGIDRDGNEITRQPSDHFRRHAYNSVVRVVNAAGRRDVP